MNEIREQLQELLEHWDDHYWRADHPEITALAVALLTGIVGLAFAWIETRLIRNPKTTDI